MCAVSEAMVVKALPQIPQGKGFSPVCVLVWCFKSLPFANNFLQILHSHLSPTRFQSSSSLLLPVTLSMDAFVVKTSRVVWWLVSICISRSSRQLNSSWQTPHWTSSLKSQSSSSTSITTLRFTIRGVLRFLGCLTSFFLRGTNFFVPDRALLEDESVTDSSRTSSSSSVRILLKISSASSGFSPIPLSPSLSSPATAAWPLTNGPATGAWFQVSSLEQSETKLSTIPIFAAMSIRIKSWQLNEITQH